MGMILKLQILQYFAVCWFIISVGAQAVGGTLYGLSPFLTNQSLYTLNVSTGVATEIGPTVVNGLIGLEVDRFGRLLAVDASTGSSRHLYELNQLTGEATSLFDLGVSEIFIEGGFAIDPLAELGYVVKRKDLYKIDLTTGDT